MTITQDRPVKVFNPKTPRVTLIAIALLAGSAIGLSLVRVQQIDKIEQAQTILTQACATNLSTNSQGAAQQVDSATQLLRSVPQVPGLGYRLAQAELAESASCIQRVRSTASLQQAQTLSTPALKTTSTTVLSTQEWQTLQTNLSSAIALLRAIPPSAAVYPQAQEQLKINQAKSPEISARLQTEAGAANAYLRAVGLIQKADQLAANPTQGNLLAAGGNVQEAIRLMESVPEGTTISDSRSITLETYRSKLTEIQTEWLTQQLQPLVKDFQAFATSLETDIGYENYLEKWSALKQQFETQTQSSAILREHPVTQTLAIAVQNYDDALTVWLYCHEGNCYNSYQVGFILDSRSTFWLPEALQLQGRTLDQAYTVDSTYSLIRQGRFVPLNNTLREIWRAAESQLKQAEEQL
jgi:hypothetical protein